MANARKLGRPPDSSSDETRGRIVEAARKCFAAHGFEATTNRQLADTAELTTGAIYHYFDSKQELYIAAHTEVQDLVYRRFQAAADAAAETFVDRINAVLDEALALNREDPSLASFLVAVRTDRERHRELGDNPALLPQRRLAFFGDLVDLGIATGELQAADRSLILDVVAAMMTGLVSASSGDPETHARAVDGMKRLIAGGLIEHQPAKL